MIIGQYFSVDPVESLHNLNPRPDRETFVTNVCSDENRKYFCNNSSPTIFFKLRQIFVRRERISTMFLNARPDRSNVAVDKHILLINIRHVWLFVRFGLARLHVVHVVHIFTRKFLSNGLISFSFFFQSN